MRPIPAGAPTCAHAGTLARALAVAPLIWLMALTPACPAAAPDVPPCPDGGERIGYLGISETSGSLTAFLSKEGGLDRVHFLSEPEVVDVDPNGPAEGKLRSGDILVSLNGYLITTEEGGRLFAHPPTDRDIEIIVRRNGRPVTLSMRPGYVCPNEVPSYLSAWTVEPVAVSLATGVPVNPEKVTQVWHPTMWLGFGLRCSMEGTLAPAHEDGTPKWRFLTQPKVISIYPDSPAAASELRIGDVIRKIDGIPIDTDDASRRIAEIGEGETVTLTVGRRFRQLEVPMVAAEPSPFAPTLRQRLGLEVTTVEPGESPIQFVGTLGEVGLEVRSPEHISVTVEESSGEITLIVGEAELRVWTMDEAE